MTEKISKFKITNLSFNVKEGHLKEIFENYGNVIDVNIIKNKFNQSLGEAILTMSNLNLEEGNIMDMDKGQIDGCIINIILESESEK